MKAPLRVAAKLAEKLRNWLTSELEPHHEAYNIDQYAHHVVTIFLNDDLDIEDEPLGTVEDYLHDIYALRCGKSLERKKNAAVEFLKSVISCDKPVDTEIRRIIDELIVRIEATKDNKPTSRKLLGPLTLNVAPSGYKLTCRKNRIEQERRYNEAFPSLPGEVKKSNLAVSLTLKRGLGPESCQKSPINKENSLKHGKQTKEPLEPACKFVFADKSEAEACLTAGLVFSLAIPDENLPSPDTMEVQPFCQTSMLSDDQNNFEMCWKSAFMSVVPTKLFSPNKSPLPLCHDVSQCGKIFRPFVINGDHCSDHLGSFRVILKFVDLFDPDSMKVFLHPEHRYSPPERSSDSLFAVDPNDLEVSNIISWSDIRRQQMRKRQNGRMDVERRRRDRTVHEDHPGKNKTKINDERAGENADANLNSKKGNGLSQHGASWNNEISSGEMTQNIKLVVITEGNEGSGNKSIDGPLLGAVGGCETDDDRLNVEDTGEVRTDDVLSFALQQLAKYEEKHGKFQDGDDDNNVSKMSMLEMNDKSDGGGDDTNSSPNSIASRSKINSIDSGMFTGRDEDCPSEEKVSSCKTLSSNDGEKTPLCNSEIGLDVTATTASWRRTPGGQMSCDGVQSSTESTISGGGTDSLFVNTECGSVRLRQNSDQEDGGLDVSRRWNEWAGPLSDSSWDSMVQRDIFHRPSPSNNHANIFHPPQLSSCVDTNVSQILQSAYVNSLFAEGSGGGSGLNEIEDPSLALNCADLERTWFSNQPQESADTESNPQEVVRGRTCSNWLENQCDLGDDCPFSHPSI